MTVRQGRALGPYVKQLMDQHNPPLVPSDLQERLGISQSAASRKLSGERRFDLHELIPLAEMLGCTVHDLLVRSVHDPDPQTRAQAAGRDSTATVSPIQGRPRRKGTRPDIHEYRRPAMAA
jgi:transcriptional regulator with XRE-family HTH domain